MIGTPPSARPMWHDPAAHARDFANRYVHELDLAVAERMSELGIADGRIGMPDDDRGIQWAAFHPYGTAGGRNSPDGRLAVDSGLLNDDLLKQNYDATTAALYKRARLRDKLDSIIAHEEAESRTGSHVKALEIAPNTALPITQRAREICTAMERGYKGK
jgi:hypothetical protein